MDAVDRFDTQRLFADRLRATDYADLCRMNQHARVMASIGGVRSEDSTREYFRKNLEHWERYGFGSRRVMEKVGCSYERDIVRAGSPEVLYRIRRPGVESRD